MPETGDELPLWIPEEETSTPANLVRISAFAVIAFLFLALLLGKDAYGVLLVVGVVVVGMLIVSVFFLINQQRYGSATLRGKAAFEFGRRFEGVIETELKKIPTKPVSIAIRGYENFGGDQSFVALDVREKIEPAEMRIGDNSTVRIPFSLQIPGDERTRRLRGIRCIVRTPNWPLGWGATFLLLPAF